MSSPDEHLEEHKRGDSEVSRRYRELPADEVPAALDDAILAHARDELQETNRTRYWRQWTAPFAIAASAVLALSILFRSGSEREALLTQQAPQASGHPPAPALDVPANVPSEPSAERELAEKRQSNAAALRDRTVAGDVAQTALAASARSASRASAPALEKSIGEKLEEAPAPGSSTKAAGQFAMTQEERVAPPSPPSANPSEIASDAISPAAETAAPAPTATATAVREHEKAAEVDLAQPAQQWLADIRKLRAQGKIAEADKQWLEFRKAFPDYTVAADDAARPRS